MKTAGVQAEDGDVDPAADHAVLREHATLEDPRRRDHDLGERVAQVQVAEPRREDAVLVEEDRHHPDQRPDEEHAHRAEEREEAEVVEPLLHAGSRSGRMAPAVMATQMNRNPGMAATA